MKEDTFLLIQHFLLIMNKREHEVVTVNRLQSQPPSYLDWFKVLLKISAKKGATLQYFNLEEQQQSQIKLKFLLKYACSQKSKNIFPQSISKLSNIPSLFCSAQSRALFYCTVHINKGLKIAFVSWRKKLKVLGSLILVQIIQKKQI